MSSSPDISPVAIAAVPSTTPNNATRNAHLASGAVLLVLLAAPFIGLYPVFMMKALCYAIFAVAFNLLLGFTGLLSFGHAAYLGSAAYATGWLVRTAGWSPELGVLAGVPRAFSRRWARCWAWSSAPSPSAARASTLRW